MNIQVRTESPSLKGLCGPTRWRGADCFWSCYSRRVICYWRSSTAPLNRARSWRAATPTYPDRGPPCSGVSGRLLWGSVTSSLTPGLSSSALLNIALRQLSFCPCLTPSNENLHNTADVADFFIVEWIHADSLKFIVFPGSLFNP